jgi:hypothetical protein
MDNAPDFHVLAFTHNTDLLVMGALVYNPSFEVAFENACSAETGALVSVDFPSTLPIPLPNRFVGRRASSNAASADPESFQA